MKIVLALFGCLLATGPIARAQGPGGPQKAAVVEVGKVVEAEDMDSRRYTGQVVSQASVQIVTRVSGEILEVGFTDGAPVKKGQMLYKLDPIQYEAAVKGCEAKIGESKAKLEYAQNSFDRNNALYKQNAGSKDSMENSRSVLMIAKASLLSAEAELITANDNLKNATIVAPINGIAGVTNYTVGNYITPASGVLVTIIQVQPIRVRFSISTGDYLSMFGSLKELKENSTVKLRLADGSWYDEPGEIELINNEANSRTDTVQIFASFPNKNYKLIAGGTVGVTLSRRVGRTLAAVVPSAVMVDNNGSYVYVVDKDSKAERRPVIIGNATDELQLIKGGLKLGETVVTKGTHKVMPGAPVAPVQGN
ncbi:MAG: efflux RND transporter periplasmic adaptor subunit [Victivallaceae bacterium]|nr:efflux RND transporter periplasmic adaptor subunit [Victivallaceae bacterium]